MSERNVELTRLAVAAFNVRDIETVIAYCDPSIEFHPLFTAVGGAVYHGHDGVRSWHRDYEDAWGDELRIEPEAYFDLADTTLGFYVMQGRGRHSGAEVAMRAAVVYRWRDGLMVYWESYANREDALRELGVSEDQLEPIAP